MKNIFKYIVSVAVLSAVTFASAVTASAQNMTEPYKDVNGICFKKSSSLNPDGKSYTVTLESFVKGEVTVTHGIKPSDIVLVLDVSGSMLTRVPNLDYTLPETANFNFFSYFNKEGNFLNKLNDKNFNIGNGQLATRLETAYYFQHPSDSKYYRLYALFSNQKITPYGGGTQVQGYFIYYQVGSTYYYVKSDGSSVAGDNPNSLAYRYSGQSTRWTQFAGTVMKTSSSATMYSGTLQKDPTKLDILKHASEAFLDVVSYKDTHDMNDEPVPSYGHKVAIVSFSTGYERVRDLTAISSGLSDLKSAINGLNAGGYTEIDLGLKDARDILNAVKDQDRSRFVVVFTDGQPRDDDENSTTRVSNDALGYAKTIKTTGEGNINAKIYAIGMVPADEAPTETAQFLNYVSSNFPNAESLSNPGSGTMNGDYYKDASGGDLSGIFEAIAGDATGGAENTTVTSESSVTVDAVTSDFNIPSGAGSQVTLKFAKCNGEDANGYLTFDDANAITVTSTTTAAQLEAAGMALSENDDIPEVILDLENNKVSVANYEYSANWCGLDESLTPAAYRGFKQILSFVIEIDEGAVGGPATATNEANSGIYVNGQPIAVFNQPQVVMPVSIWIKKQGLEGNDSAVFTLKRSEKTYEEYRAMGLVDADGYLNPKDSQIKYQNFTKVVVNDNTMDADGVVKITGLDSRYIYTIKEDAWAEAAYDFENGTQYTLKVNKKDAEPSNPFIFINTPNNEHSNAKVGEDNSHNVFNVK